MRAAQSNFDPDFLIIHPAHALKDIIDMQLMLDIIKNEKLKKPNRRPLKKPNRRPLNAQKKK